MTLQKVIEFIEKKSGAESCQDCHEIMAALKAKGVSPTYWLEAPSRATRKPRAKKVNVKTTFNPDLCHARCFECTDPDKFGKDGNSSDKTLYLSMRDFQCVGKNKVDGGNYCYRHKESCAKNRCHESGKLFMGDFSDSRPENPTRVSKTSGVNKYVWLEDMDGEYDNFLPEKKTTKKAEKKTKKTKKSKKPEVEVEEVEVEEVEVEEVEVEEVEVEEVEVVEIELSLRLLSYLLPDGMEACRIGPDGRIAVSVRKPDGWVDDDDE
jgi:hypothetical protein